MMSPMQHRTAAERLIAEGEAVVAKIADAKERRSGADALEQLTLTNRMDELGKKAMGIWAQAQVHATLAAPLSRTPDVVVTPPQSQSARDAELSVFADVERLTRFLRETVHGIDPELDVKSAPLIAIDLLRSANTLYAEHGLWP